ncbi:hypothetical protein TorRG33x02_305300 [Trema orientale]|uniref:Uncharacterized protein n=1 Tax=Trema orientale TaxID=63057 RepID=A0A2P5BXM7_TREOI|nr:hypothetical protein TorRG33x02_305300 [Trema orientale]
MIEQDKLKHGARCTLTLRLDGQAQTCKDVRDPLLPTLRPIHLTLIVSTLLMLSFVQS